MKEVCFHIYFPCWLGKCIVCVKKEDPYIRIVCKLPVSPYILFTNFQWVSNTLSVGYLYLVHHFSGLVRARSSTLLLAGGQIFLSICQWRIADDQFLILDIITLAISTSFLIALCLIREEYLTVFIHISLSCLWKDKVRYYNIRWGEVRYGFQQSMEKVRKSITWARWV